jgi:hypothetical protein
VIGLIVAGSLLALPAYNAPTPSLSGGLVTQHGLLYINPLSSRVLKFARMPSAFGFMAAFNFGAEAA